MPQTSKILVTDLNGTQVWVSQKQFDTLQVLEQTRKGGCASITGYIPTTNYDVPPVVNIQMLTRFSYDRLLNRKRDALNAIEFSDIPANVVPTNKLKGKTQQEWFEIRKQQELDSIDKTISGNRSDAQRQGHDRCYATFGHGISAHLDTERGNDGLMHPVLTDGYPTVKSIMVSFLELNRKVVKDGVYKTVNSGASVLMKNAINSILNQRSIGIRKVSLKDDNFEKLVIDKNVILPSNVQSLV